jgi:hypothetical protein
VADAHLGKVLFDVRILGGVVFKIPAVDVDATVIGEVDLRKERERERMSHVSVVKHEGRMIPVLALHRTSIRT